MRQQKFSLRSRIRSFAYALSGIARFIREEHNAWIHAVATAGGIIAGRIAGVSRGEWIALFGVIALVWISEMINTCIERLSDLITREPHPEIKFIKDLA